MLDLIFSKRYLRRKLVLITSILTMVLHFYSRSIKQVKYIVEKKEIQPKILTKSEWKRIPPIRHPIPTLPNTSNNNFLLNTDQLISDVENSRNRRTIINPPSLSNNQLKEEVKNQWYFYTKISEWIDYIYNSGFVKGISEKGFIQYFKHLIKNSLPDNILFKILRFLCNCFYEGCLKQSVNWSKEKGKEIKNYVSNVCHKGWNISKEYFNKFKTFITGSEKKEENDSTDSKVGSYFSSIKDKFSNIFFWKNKNIGKNQIEDNKIDNNIIVESNKIDNSIIVESNNNKSTVVLEGNNKKSFLSWLYSSVIDTPIRLYYKMVGKKDIPEIEGNNKIEGNKIDNNIIVESNNKKSFLSWLYSSVIDTSIKLYYKMVGKKDIPEIEGNNKIEDYNNINNQIEDYNNINNIIEYYNSINNIVEDNTNINSQIEDNNNGWYYRFRLDRVYDFLKSPIENIKNFFKSKKEKNILDLNNNQNIIENTPIIEEIESNIEESIGSEENNAPIIEEVESITEEPIRSEKNPPSDLINKSTNKMEEVESKKEWYDPIEDSEEKWFDAIEGSEEDWHDPIEGSEEQWKNFQEEL